jgi:hypothetical protein
MKKIILTSFMLLVLCLTACSPASSDTQVASDAANPELPITTQLVVGTMKLDGTEHEVTSEQAAVLLPLWQVYSELSVSDTAAQEEIDALVEQIQGTLTTEQMKAITDMQLTRQDTFALMQEKGINPGGGQGFSAEQIATAQAGRASGGGFTPPDGGGFAPPDGGGFAPPDGAGGFPGGTGQGSGGESLSPEQIATAQAGRASGAGGPNRIPTALIDLLIKYLEDRAFSSVHSDPDFSW